MPAATAPTRERSVRRHLAVFALALALPVTLFVGVVLWRFADTERARLEGRAVSVARAVANAVDQELAGLISTVEVVSLFSSLQIGDLGGFHAQASAVQARTGVDVVLRDLSGRQVANTRRAWGEPLPTVVLDIDAEALRTGGPVVSNLNVGVVAQQEPLFAVTRPVATGDGAAAYLLSLSLPVERVRQAVAADLASNGVPADWTVAVVDRAGVILARNRAHEQLVGRPATSDFRTGTRDRSEGTWKGFTADGTPVFTAFVRSRLAGWSVGVGVPESALAAPLRRAMLLLLGLGGGLAALSAALALALGGRIARPIRALAERAAALGRGEAVPPLRTPLREVNRVAGELEAAAASLAEREAALRASEARLRAILATVPVGVVIAEAPSGRIVEGNKEAERVFGHPVLPSPDTGSYGEWVSRHPDGRRVDAAEYPLARVVRGGEDHAELEVVYRRGDGREAWVRLVAAPIRDDEGRVLGGVVACLDIDREKRAEAELRRWNEELESRVAERTAERDRMWRFSTDLMLVSRVEDRTIAAVNPAWTALLGWAEDELLGARLNDFVHPDDMERTLAEAAKLAGGAATLKFENRYRRKDGSYRWLCWTAVPDGGFVHSVARDVTAEKAAQAELAEAQEQLRQAQKMEAVGQLTGGVAHDFNNLLQVVMGSLDLLQRRLPRDMDERMRRPLQSAAEAAKRGAVLTARLLAFSRRQTLDPKPVEANRLVVGMSDLLRRSLGEAVRIETVLGGGLWRTCADPNQLESAVLNLAVNARDAMPAEGGRLTVETANAHLDGRYAREAGIPEGQYVMIAVSDTGSGMSAEVQARAFEPFFTTKDVGQGTGLGLSQVYGFVRQSGGHVKIYSEPGEGTTVKIYLPRLAEGAAPDEAAGAAAGGKEGRRPPPRAGAGETVLVVEDDEDVRRFTTDALRELGYRVLEANGARAALRLLDAHGAGVDLLFTDVVMPDMNGRKLAEEALRRRPDLRVLFATGYSRNAIIHNGVLDPGVQLIGKPFTVEELAAKLRAALERRDEKRAAPRGG